MINSRDETNAPDMAAAGQIAPKPMLREPERRGWPRRLAPSGGLVLGLLLGALAWLAAFTLWRLFG